MKKYALYLLLTLIALTGCKHRPSPYDRTLRQVGELADTLPDSALVLLQTLPASDSLNREQHARWCMLQGRIVDKLFTPLPAPYHYEQAVRWYAAHGSAEEHAQMQLYLGRAYMEEGDFDRAMTAYTGALRTAERNLLDDKAGYINSYMGDLYSEDRRTKFFLSLSNWRGRRVPWLLSRRKTRTTRTWHLTSGC